MKSLHASRTFAHHSRMLFAMQPLGALFLYPFRFVDRAVVQPVAPLVAATALSGDRGVLRWLFDRLNHGREFGREFDRVAAEAALHATLLQIGDERVARALTRGAGDRE